MNAVVLLARPAEAAFTDEEDALITRQLALAYWRDEHAGTNPDLVRLTEKVRLRMIEAEVPEPVTPESLPPENPKP